MSNATWYVAHRYTEFCMLKDFLILQNPSTKEFQGVEEQFPSKAMCLTYRQTALKERIEGLAAFLIFYLSRGKSCRQNSIDALCSFLAVSVGVCLLFYYCYILVDCLIDNDFRMSLCVFCHTDPRELISVGTEAPCDTACRQRCNHCCESHCSGCCCGKCCCSLYRPCCASSRHPCTGSVEPLGEERDECHQAR